MSSIRCYGDLGQGPCCKAVMMVLGGCSGDHMIKLFIIRLAAQG